MLIHIYNGKTPKEYIEFYKTLIDLFLAERTQIVKKEAAAGDPTRMAEIQAYKNFEGTNYSTAKLLESGAIASTRSVEAAFLEKELEQRIKQIMAQVKTKLLTDGKENSLISHVEKSNRQFRYEISTHYNVHD